MSAKLHELLKTHEHLTREVAKMRADADAAEATEKRILEDGKIDDSEILALTNARTVRELIARRLPTITEMKAKLGPQIEKELSKASQLYNRAVRTAGETKQAEIIEANRAFWQGDLRRLNKWVETEEIPAVREIRRTAFNLGFENNPGADFWAGQARGFLDLYARYAKALKLSLD